MEKTEKPRKKRDVKLNGGDSNAQTTRARNNSNNY